MLTTRGRPLLSVVVPAHNEAGILENNLETLCRHLSTLSNRYDWEVVLVDDGSLDDTPALVDACASRMERVKAVHHRVNGGLGQALRTGFEHASGEIIVTLDLDLSYAPDHVGRLADHLLATGADMVIASPYQPGGTTENVPWSRLVTSRWANRLLSVAATQQLHTLTGMVRAYDAAFLRRLDLRATGMEINPEIVYKGTLLNARIEEIPARLAWLETPVGAVRTSSMKTLRQTAAVLRSGFLFRPAAFFVLPGLLILLFAAWVGVWMVIHVAGRYAVHTGVSWAPDRASLALSEAFQLFPHTFVIGGIAMILGVQLVGLGLLSLQTRAAFQDLYHQGSALNARPEIRHER